MRALEERVGVSKNNHEYKKSPNRPVVKIRECELLRGLDFGWWPKKKKKKKWEENVFPGLLLRLLDRQSPKWCKSLVRLAIFRFYLSFKRNATENSLISSLKSSLHWPVNGIYTSMFSPQFKIYWLFYSNHSYYIYIGVPENKTNNLYLYSWRCEQCVALYLISVGLGRSRFFPLK